MMDRLALKRMCLPMGARLYFGGDSSSSVENKTFNTDARIVGGDGSTNTSVNGNSGPVEITTTDHGAVSGSLQLAMRGVELAHQSEQQVLSTTGGLLEGALKNQAQQQQAFTDTVKDIKTSDVRVLVVAGLAVVAFGAIAMFKRGA
jgi:hypothetical protein